MGTNHKKRGQDSFMSIDDCTAHMRRLVSEKRHIKKICGAEVEIIHRIVDYSDENKWWISCEGILPPADFKAQQEHEEEMEKYLSDREGRICEDDIFIVHSGTSIVG